MAKVMSVSYVDDLTGDPVDAREMRSTEFGIDGRGYEIDLGPASRDKFMSAMEPFIRAARRSGGTNRRTAVATSSAARARSGDESKVIRAWARENGWANLAERGRIPADVVEAYHNNRPRQVTPETIPAAVPAPQQAVQDSVKPTFVSPDPEPATAVSEPATAKPKRIPGKTSASKPATVDQAPTDEMIMAFCMANGRPPAAKGRYANKVTPAMREFYATSGPKIAASA